MISAADTLLRIAASRRRRALPVSRTFRLAADPLECFAVAPIKVVAEDLIQAVAFGDPDGEPRIIHEALPLSRATAFLEPLADALEAYLRRAAQTGGARIYVPHANALEMLTLLAPRYERNVEASAKVQRLGYLWRVLRELAHYPGQQVVVVMSDTLRSHIVSGASPIKDTQLRYLTTWADPPADVDVEVAADEAALRPAAGMLYFRDDERVESLRHDLKRSRRNADVSRAQIERIQDQNALSEWQAMTRARDALWALPLSRLPRLDGLMTDNVRMLARALDEHHVSASRTVAMARLYDDHSVAHDQLKAALVEGDDSHFEAEVLKGRAIRAVIAETNIPRPNFRPQRIRVTTTQAIVRPRQRSYVRWAGQSIEAMVESIDRSAAGEYSIWLNITSGVRIAGRHRVGDSLRLIEGRAPAFAGHRRRMLIAVHRASPLIVVGDPLPVAQGQVDPARDLLGEIGRSQSW